MKDNTDRQVKYSPEVAWLKICKWCAYQERSQQEVRDKLYSYGLHGVELETIISNLITGQFLNEERFAIAFAGGKFRQLGWGKVKIRQALKLKKVSDYCIRKALESINEKDYQSRLGELLRKKQKEVREKDPFRRRYILLKYAHSRGYESDLVRELLGEESGD